MEKKVALAVIGSRNFNNYELMCKEINNRYNPKRISKIISGGAKGADSFAERYAHENNIYLRVLEPDWSKGKGAGFIRNTEIVTECDDLIAFWDGESRGTKDSINKAKKQGRNVTIIYF